MSTLSLADWWTTPYRIINSDTSTALNNIYNIQSHNVYYPFQRPETTSSSDPYSLQSSSNLKKLHYISTSTYLSYLFYALFPNFLFPYFHRAKKRGRGGSGTPPRTCPLPEIPYTSPRLGALGCNAAASRPTS